MDWKVLRGLERELKENRNPERREKVVGLLSWYANKGFWSNSQKKLAYKIYKECQPEKRYMVYAIRQGNSIKIGMTCNLKSRIKTLQTGSKVKLKKEWSLEGLSKKHAQDYERALHKICKEYKIRGEWYRDQAIFLCKRFEPNIFDARRRLEEIEIMMEANKYI